MVTIVIFVFAIAIYALGGAYQKACQTLSEDLLNKVKFRRDTETEGGDNWPSMQFETGNSKSCYEDSTYAG
jgi:hypothetical protein